MECNQRKNAFLRFCDGIIVMACVATPFILTGILIAWRLQIPDMAYINLDRHYEVQESTPFRMEAPLAINSRGASIYKIKIYDANGSVVYAFEDLEVHDFVTSVVVPGDLPVGTYSMGGSLEYRMNPIKAAKIFVNFGTFTIKRSK